MSISLSFSQLYTSCNPGAWEKWKKEQGKMKKGERKKEKGASM